MLTDLHTFVVFYACAMSMHLSHGQ